MSETYPIFSLNNYIHLVNRLFPPLTSYFENFTTMEKLQE